MALLALGAVLSAKAASVEDCRGISDDAKRLQCYDTVFGNGAVHGTTEEAAPVSAPSPLPTGAVVPTQSMPLGSGEAMSALWELDPSEKRGTFVVRTYLPNFLLPALYTTSINREPSSPTRGAGAYQPSYRPVETEFQISLRAKAAENFLLPSADLWLAYTQQSFWQLWDHADSAPFRDTDYQPQIIYVIPTPKEWSGLPFGWQWRMTQLSFSHQSNGESDPLSRSWNHVDLDAGFEKGDFGLQVQEYYRIPESRSSDDNPDLVSYLGATELSFSWLGGPSTATLTWRISSQSLNRGSLRLQWSFPVVAKQPAGLRWFVQVFTGYGETLLDYNHRQTSIGAGVTLFQF
ncbi:MAG: phospholipase A [Burkholderiaceae bacterium]|jgi:phospholipase A1